MGSLPRGVLCVRAVFNVLCVLCVLYYNTFDRKSQSRTRLRSRLLKVTFIRLIRKIPEGRTSIHGIMYRAFPRSGTRGALALRLQLSYKTVLASNACVYTNAENACCGGPQSPVIASGKLRKRGGPKASPFRFIRASARSSFPGPQGP